MQKFLDDTLAHNQEYYTILQKLRDIVFSVYPDTTERMMYGGIMFSQKEDFGGIFVSKKHISFEFGNGYSMQDPDKVLEGTGKFRRHLKITFLNDIENKNVVFFVKQAV